MDKSSFHLLKNIEKTIERRFSSIGVLVARCVVLSFKGKTTDFDSVYGGSIPSGTAKPYMKLKNSVRRHADIQVFPVYGFIECHIKKKGARL